MIEGCHFMAQELRIWEERGIGVTGRENSLRVLAIERGVLEDNMGSAFEKIMDL